MPGFSSYSQIVKPAEFVEPVSLDLLAKGTVYKEQMLEKNLEDVNNLISYMDNIPSLQGIDTEKKNEILNNVKQQAAQLSYSDLGNPAVANQLKSYITSITKDPDMQGIMQRGYSYENMLKEKKDVEAKGGQYFNYGLRQAQKYMEDGKYIRNTTFNNLGGIAPNEAEILKKAKDLTEKKITRVKVGNQYELRTQYDPEDLAAAIQTVASGYNNYNLYHKFQFDGTTENMNWDEYANSHFAPIIETAKTNLSLATANYNKATKDSDKAYYKKYMDDFTNQINTYEKLLNNPTATEEIKQKAFNSYQNEILSNQVSAMDAIQQSELKMDDNTKMGIQFANSLALENRRAQNAQDLAILKGELKYNPEGVDPGIISSDLQFLHQIINNKGNIPNTQTVNIGEKNKYFWTPSDIKSDKKVQISTAAKDIMPKGEGNWISINGVDVLNKLNGKESKVSTSYKLDEAGNQIPTTESSVGKNYKYLFKDQKSGKVIALVEIGGKDQWETVTNNSVASQIDKGIYGTSKNFDRVNNEVERFRSGYETPPTTRENNEGSNPPKGFVPTSFEVKNLLGQDTYNELIRKGYTANSLATSAKDFQIQFNTNDPVKIKEFLIKNAN